jgi:MFS family permease
MSTTTAPGIRVPRTALAGAAAALLLSGALADIQGSVLLAPSLGAIIKDLHLNTGEVAWTLNASTIASAVSVALTSRMGDIFGHRKILLIITVLSMLGCVVAALAPGFPLLVVGRFMMGLSVGVPLGWGMVRPRATAPQIRVISVWLSTIAAIFTPLALNLGGLFLNAHLPWQSSLWFVFFVYALLLVFAFLTPETPSRERNALALDWPGAIGIGLWATAALIALNNGSSDGWASPRFYGWVIPAVVLFAVWVIQQHLTRLPVMSFEAMDKRQTLTGYLAICTIGMSGSILYISIPVILQTPKATGWGLGLSPLGSALPLLAVVPGSFVASYLVGVLVPRLGPRTVLVMAYIASLGCFLGLAFGHDAYGLFFLWNFLYGATLMTIWGTGYYLVASSTRQDNTAITFGVTNIVLFLVSAFTTAILLNATAPNASGAAPESSYVVVYLGVAALMVILAIVQRVLAPRRVTDFHAIDVSDSVNGLAVPAPGTER